MWQLGAIGANGYSATQVPGTGELIAAAVVAPGPPLLDRWDQLVRHVPGSDVAQLSGWARVRAEAGYEPIYVLARRGDTLVGGAQILRRPVPVLGAVGYLPYGPVVAAGCPGSDLRSDVTEVMCDVLRDLPGLGLGALFVQPCLGDTAVGSRLRRMGFRASEAGIAPSASIRVDLSRSEDELRAGLSRRLRTWTRQWDQRGVRVRLGDAADVPILGRLAAATAAHQGFPAFGAGYLETLYRSLRAGDDIAMLIAELHGTPVAAELLTICGGVIKSRVTGLDRARAEVTRLNVAAAMIWSAIRYGKSRGAQWYDFGGLRRELAERMHGGEPVERAALPGPDQFKLGFGGVPCLYPPPVERIHSPLARRLYAVGTNTAIGQVALEHGRRLLRGGGNRG